MDILIQFKMTSATLWKDKKDKCYWRSMYFINTFRHNEAKLHIGLNEMENTD